MKRLPRGAGPRSLDCAEKRWGRGQLAANETSGDPMIKGRETSDGQKAVPERN